jgi:cellulose biosynthesis protein BcsQ
VTGPPSQPHPLRVVTVASNKGGVGKTTVATNLAVYFRALREDLPVLVVGLDDQTVVDRMFQLERLGSDDANLKHCWAERSLDRAIRLGQYGVHYVPSPPDTAPLKSRADDPETLARILVRTKWDGVVILDTKSDLEGLTRNALFAADRVIVPVADRSSLDEADKVFALLDHLRRGRERARVLLTLAGSTSGRSSSGRSSAAAGRATARTSRVARGPRRWPRRAARRSRCSTTRAAPRFIARCASSPRRCSPSSGSIPRRPASRPRHLRTGSRRCGRWIGRAPCSAASGGANVGAAPSARRPRGAREDW